MVFQERTYSVLLVSASDKFNAAMAPLLPATDYWPITSVGSVSEAKRHLTQRFYDMILINAPLPDDFGIRLAVDACNESGAGVLLFVKREHYNDIYSKVVRYGVMTLSKPTSVQMIAQSLRVLCATRERLRKVEERQATVEEKIEEMRLINRAKWLLIEHLRMSEAQAHRHIEKQSMDLRVSKREVAQSIIADYTG